MALHNPANLPARPGLVRHPGPAPLRAGRVRARAQPARPGGHQARAGVRHDRQDGAVVEADGGGVAGGDGGEGGGCEGGGSGGGVEG